MSFTTKEFFSYITQNGLARPNRFYVVINLPSSINSASNVKALSLMCDQTELPSKTINVSETKYNGDIKKIAQSKMYYQQQFVFNVSSKMIEKEIIDKWMSLIINSSNELEYHDNYVTDIEVYQLDTNDNPVHAVKFTGCFPVINNPLTVSNSDSNTVHKLMVQFAYEKWDVILSTSAVSNVESSSSSAQVSITSLVSSATSVSTDSLSSVLNTAIQSVDDTTTKNILSNISTTNLAQSIADLTAVQSTLDTSAQSVISSTITQLTNKLNSSISDTLKSLF